MLQSLRPLLTRILNPLARNLNINPNIVTVISPFVAALQPMDLQNHNLILGFIAILFSGFLDVVDGAVARYHDRASPFGAFLDSTMDRFADAIIYIGIIFGGYCDWFVGVLAIHSAITVSYARARAEITGCRVQHRNCRKGSPYDNLDGRSNNRILRRRYLLYIHNLHSSDTVLLYCSSKNRACLEAVE